MATIPRSESCPCAAAIPEQPRPSRADRPARGGRLELADGSRPRRPCRSAAPPALGRPDGKQRWPAPPDAPPPARRPRGGPQTRLSSGPPGADGGTLARGRRYTPNFRVVACARCHAALAGCAEPCWRARARARCQYRLGVQCAKAGPGKAPCPCTKLQWVYRLYSSLTWRPVK